MLRSFYHNEGGEMSIILPMLGLMMAAGIILITIFSIVFNNPLQDEVEMQTASYSFTSTLRAIDTCSYETSKSFLFPPSTYIYQFSLSPESITVSHTCDTTPVVYRESFITDPWIRTIDDIWVNASDLHRYLFKYYGSYGTQNDPIGYTKEIIHRLSQECNQSYEIYLNDPYVLNVYEPVIIEKCIIYLDKDYNGIWEKKDIKLDYLLVYQ
ncbi:MAG: hypothetical protein QCH96_06455 [Candidatus Thermoplasmatota archaeon]|nr:hypothetical protein [Candidatus Thermoplasmatota archaeon]